MKISVGYSIQPIANILPVHPFRWLLWMFKWEIAPRDAVVYHPNDHEYMRTGEEVEHIREGEI